MRISSKDFKRARGGPIVDLGPEAEAQYRWNRLLHEHYAWRERPKLYTYYAPGQYEPTFRVVYASQVFDAFASLNEHDGLKSKSGDYCLITPTDNDEWKKLGASYSIFLNVNGDTTGPHPIRLEPGIHSEKDGKLVEIEHAPSPPEVDTDPLTRESDREMLEKIRRLIR